MVAPHGRSIGLVNRGQAVVESRTGLCTREVKVREERLWDEHLSDGHLSGDLETSWGTAHCLTCLSGEKLTSRSV